MEVEYNNKLHLVFGDNSYRIKFSVPCPVYSVIVELDRVTPEEAVNEAIENLRRKIIDEYNRTRSIRKVEQLVREYIYLLKNKSRIVEEIKRRIERIDSLIYEYIEQQFPVDISNMSVPEIDLNNIPINMECRGNIESGTFQLRTDYGLSYTYGKREYEGKTELEFEWGKVIVTKRKIRDVHNAEHCLFYDENEETVYATIIPKDDYKIVKTEYYESHSSFYHYENDGYKEEKILRATQKPIVKLISKCEGSYSDRHSYSYYKIIEQYYVFPKNAKVLVMIKSYDFEDYEIR